MGCVFGFICIPLFLLLMVPVNGLYVSPFNISQEGQNREQSETFTPESSNPKDYGASYNLIWTGIMGDLNLYERPIREQVRGYRRITNHNVLDHETRQKIFEIIQQNPGISLSRLAELSHLNESTLRYHISRIAKEKCITAFDKGRSHHFFENHHRYSYEEQEYLVNYSSGQSGKIMNIIHDKPGITRREIAEKLGLASPTVTRTVQRLADEGLILLVKEGKFTRHFLPIGSPSLDQ